MTQSCPILAGLAEMAGLAKIANLAGLAQITCRSILIGWVDLMYLMDVRSALSGCFPTLAGLAEEMAGLAGLAQTTCKIVQEG